MKKDSFMYPLGKMLIFLMILGVPFKGIAQGSPETIKDLDGNEYATVKIGIQVWMEENLKTTKFNDGTAIPLVSNSTAWKTSNTSAYCYYENDGITNKKTYGVLYNWFTATTSTLCPTGWHLPSDEEWATLKSYVGIDAGEKLKEKDTIHWSDGWMRTEAANKSGFTALPGGKRDNNGTFHGIRYTGYWWSGTEFDDTTAHCCTMYFINSLAANLLQNKQNGLSVRCLKNN